MQALTKRILKRKLIRSYRYFGIGLIAAIAFVDQPRFGLTANIVPVLQDVFSLLLLGLLAIAPGRHLWRRIYKKHTNKSLHLFSTASSQQSRWPLIQNVVAAFAFLFLLIWFSRWFSGHGFGDFSNKAFLRYRTILHASLFMSVWAFFLGSRRLLSFLKFLDLTPGRLVILLYGLSSLLGAFALILPFSLQESASVSLIDAFFLSVSALTVTGLVPVTVSTTFNLFGQSVLLVLMQLGGIGIVIISFGLAAITRNRLSLAQSLMGRELFDLPHLGSTSSFVQRVVAFTLAAELLGAIWIYSGLPVGIKDRVFVSIFLSVSSFCNAGFTPFAANMEIPGLVWLKSGICILVLLGSLGFPIIFELLSKFKRANRIKPYSSILVLTTTIGLSLVAVGAIGIFTIESFSDPTTGVWSRLGGALFHSISRTAGFNVSNLGDSAFGTQLLIAFLMSIGGAPLSMAGGIKTTTAGVIVVAAISLIRGHKWVQFRQSEISPMVLHKCVTIVVLYSFALFLSIFLLAALEPGDPWALTFEAISALSTVGYSLGVTAELGNFSKMLIIALMLAGRLGLVTIVYIGIGRVTTQKYRYPHEHFYVG